MGSKGGGSWGLPWKQPCSSTTHQMDPAEDGELDRDLRQVCVLWGGAGVGGGPNREGLCLRLQIKYNTGDRLKDHSMFT